MKIKAYKGCSLYFSVLFLVTYLILLLSFPQASSQGVENGLKLSFSVLIPSLYPFLVCSSFFVKSGILHSIPGKALSVFVLSIAGGYPMGAKCLAELYEKGEADRDETVKLLFFCINPSVSFVVSTVGITLLKSLKAGLIILSAILLSSATMWVASAFYKRNKKVKGVKVNVAERTDFSSAFVSAVKDGILSVILICGYVVIFSSLSAIAEAIPLNENIKIVLSCVLEVTKGAVVAAEKLSLPFVSAVVSFGGISTLFQLKAVLQNTDISFLLLLILRCASGLLSAIYTSILLKLFPVTSETFVTDGFRLSRAPSYSVSVSVCLVLMSILFIMGDSIIKKNALRYDGKDYSENSLTEKGSESKI